MGLDTTHGCWHGPYSAFQRFRDALAQAAWGESVDNYVGYDGSKPLPENDALVTLIDHSDCEGEIAVADCIPLAERLEQLAPLLPVEESGGYDWGRAALDFAHGLRIAARAGEPVEGA